MNRISHKETERLKEIGAKMVVPLTLTSARAWAHQIQSGLDDSQSLSQIFEHFVRMTERIQVDCLVSCIAIAKQHIGEAERSRKAKGIKLGDLSTDAATSIRDEEHGETIAAQAIQRKIQHLLEKVTMHE